MIQLNFRWQKYKKAIASGLVVESYFIRIFLVMSKVSEFLLTNTYQRVSSAKFIIIAKI